MQAHSPEAQSWFVPQLAELQHLSPTQFPLRQSPADEQEDPSACCATQVDPAAGVKPTAQDEQSVPVYASEQEQDPEAQDP